MHFLKMHFIVFERCNNRLALKQSTILGSCNFMASAVLFRRFVNCRVPIKVYIAISNCWMKGLVSIDTKLLPFDHFICMLNAFARAENNCKTTRLTKFSVFCYTKKQWTLSCIRLYCFFSSFSHPTIARNNAKVLITNVDSI